VESEGNCGGNGGITNRTAETEIDIAIITETKKKNKGSEDIGNHVMIYCGERANKWASSGVAIGVREDWKPKKKDYTWISDRMSNLQ
jgi:hypothetical protein